MNTVTCGKCGQEVTASTKACPKCGASQKKKGKLKFILLGILVFGVVLAIMNSTSNDKKLRLTKAYIAHIAANGYKEIYEFENLSDKPIEAFAGEFIVYDKSNKVVDCVPLQWASPIKPKSKFYLCRTFINERLADKRVDETIRFLASAAIEVGTTIDNLAVVQKYEFRCTQIDQPK
jgi:hypothetical protein